MSQSAIQQLAVRSKQGKHIPARVLWHWMVASVTMLTLVVMLFAATSHVHATGALDDDACVVCNLAFDSLDDVPVVPTVVIKPAVTNFYYLLVSTPPSLVDVFHPISPPSCGPPSLTA